MAKVGRPAMPDRYRTELRLDTHLAEVLKKIAAHEGRFMNAQIEYFLRKCVEQYIRDNGTEWDK